MNDTINTLAYDHNKLKDFKNNITINCNFNIVNKYRPFIVHFILKNYTIIF